MQAQLLAWLMSAFSFLFPLIFGQPVRAPETRVSPYVEEMPPDKYGVWPTQEFEIAEPPLWLPEWGLRSLYVASNPAVGRNEGLVALYRGRLVCEYYGEGWDSDTLHPVNSVTKSVTQALVGIAIREGYINSIQDKVIDYFPDAAIEIAPELKEKITIDHLLTMTSGLAGDQEEALGMGFADWFAAHPGEEAKAALARRWEQDSAKTLLEIYSMTSKPGQRWNYSSDGAHLLLGLVARAIDRPLEEFVDEMLFGPLGITNYTWAKWGDIYYGGACLYLTPRDMAKLGYLYLNYGRWEDRQLLPADYVAQSGPVSKSPFGYGRLFWNVPFAPFGNAYGASGANGQRVDIFPLQDLVIVRTAAAQLCENGCCPAAYCWLERIIKIQ